MIPQFFSNYWGFGDSMPGPEDYMSFQIGIFHFILAICGIIAGRRNRIIVISGITYFLFIFMMTQFSAGVWKILPVIRMLQFPWRILMITSLLQVICFCGIKNLKLKKTPLFYSTVITLFVIMILWHREQFVCRDWSKCDLFSKNTPSFLLKKEKEAISRAYYPFCNENEFLSKYVKGPLPPPRNGGPIITLKGNVKIISGNSSMNRIMYTLCSKGSSSLRINQIYLPGWKVKINGLYVDDPVLIKNLTRSGLMTLPLGNGYYSIEAWYDGPPWLLLRNMIIGLGIFLYLGLFIYEKKNITAQHRRKQ